MILAGGMQKKALTEVLETSKVSSTTSAPLADDPWGKWIATSGGTGLVAPNGGPRISNTVQPPRKLESPIEDRFARHDGALQDLKQHTDQEIEVLKESIAKIESSMEVQNSNMQANMEATNAEFKAIRSETANQLQAMTGVFSETLKTAIAQQETQLASQFPELKHMIQNRPVSISGSSPPSKKSKTGPNDGDDGL